MKKEIFFFFFFAFLLNSNSKRAIYNLEKWIYSFGRLTKKIPVLQAMESKKQIQGEMSNSEIRSVQYDRNNIFRVLAFFAFIIIIIIIMFFF